MMASIIRIRTAETNVVVPIKRQQPSPPLSVVRSMRDREAARLSRAGVDSVLASELADDMAASLSPPGRLATRSRQSSEVAP
jgi:hypothetical protein